MDDELHTTPPEEEGDDTVNDPDDVERVGEDDVEDVDDHGDDEDDESDTDTA